MPRKRVDEGRGVAGEQYPLASGSHRAMSERTDRSALGVESNIVDNARAVSQLVRESHQLLAKARAGSSEMRPVHDEKHVRASVERVERDIAALRRIDFDPRSKRHIRMVAADAERIVARRPRQVTETRDGGVHAVCSDDIPGVDRLVRAVSISQVQRHRIVAAVDAGGRGPSLGTLRRRAPPHGPPRPGRYEEATMLRVRSETMRLRRGRGGAFRAVRSSAVRAARPSRAHAVLARCRD